VLVALVAAVFAVGAVPASATTHTDPTGDNCKAYLGIGNFCGFDIATAADSTDANGTVHLAVTYPAHDCLKNGVSLVINVPSFEIYDSAATGPVSFGPHLIGLIQQGLHGYELRQLPSNVTTPLASVITGTAPTTVDVAVPPAAAGALGTFKWLASNSCIGEAPNEASDIAPNTGLYDHAGSAGGGGGGVTKVAITAAVAKTLAGVKPTKAATLLKKGGLPITFAAPGTGSLKVTVARIKFIRAAGFVRLAQTTTLAKLSVTVTKVGTVKKTVKLTKAGRALIKGARKTNTLKVTVTFKSGAVSVAKSKKLKVTPRPH